MQAALVVMEGDLPHTMRTLEDDGGFHWYTSVAGSFSASCKCAIWRWAVWFCVTCSTQCASLRMMVGCVAARAGTVGRALAIQTTPGHHAAADAFKTCGLHHMLYPLNTCSATADEKDAYVVKLLSIRR